MSKILLRKALFFDCTDYYIMKVSNETKIGAITLVTIALLFFGFNFLKGKSVFKSGFFLKARFEKTKGLQASNPVVINGYQVGTVYSIDAEDKNLTHVIVEIKLNDNFNIPVNSVASISSNPLGSSSIVIEKGNSTQFLKSEQSLTTSEGAGGLMSQLTDKLGPVTDGLTQSLVDLDSLFNNLNSVLNDNNKAQLATILNNMNQTTAHFAVMSASMQQLLNSQSGAVAKTMNNMATFTGNLNTNNAKINSSIANMEKMSQNFSELDLKSTLANMNASINSLKTSMEQLNSTNGTVGALLNDRTMYDRINATIRSMNTLLDDLRVHPKRYVNISIFGKKDKNNYLTTPLVVDSVHVQ